MANPRQRRKQRSSTHRAVSHAKHAKRNLKKTPPIRGPKILQDAWDPTLTVRQNYVNMGLVVSLDPSAHGGVEKLLGGHADDSMAVDKISHNENVAGPSSAPQKTASLSQSSSVPSGFGKIIRDNEGNVLRIELPTEEDDEERDLEEKEMDMEEELESRLDADVRAKWATNFSGSTAVQGAAGKGKAKTDVVGKLEQCSVSTTGKGTTTMALPISGVGSRHVSSGEVRYLSPLAKKYGEDVEAMARDVKLNPEQRTEGQLRRALKKAGLR